MSPRRQHIETACACGHLEGLLSGGHQPIRLYPYYRDACVESSEPRSPADLFSDLSRRPGFSPKRERELHAAPVADRRALLMGLLAFCSTGRRGAAQEHAEHCRYRANPQRGLARSFWGIARGLLEASRRRRAVDVDLKQCWRRSICSCPKDRRRWCGGPSDDGRQRLLRRTREGAFRAWPKSAYWTERIPGFERAS